MPDRVSVQESWNRMPRKPISTSRLRPWGRVTVDLCEADYSMEFQASPLDHHMIFYCFDGAGVMRQDRNGQKSEDMLAPGSSMLMPAGLGCLWEGVAPTHLRIRVPTECLMRAAMEVPGMRQPVELLSVFHTRDSFIERFGELFKAELEIPPHPGQAMLVDAASAAFCLHLIRTHCAGDAPREYRVYGLPPRRLALVVGYMNDNFEEVIRLDELASLAGVSRFHFARMFKVSTGKTPMQYLEYVRVERATEMLTKGRGTVLEIAKACGFADASYFARRFRAVTSHSPSDYMARRSRSA